MATRVWWLRLCAVLMLVHLTGAGHLVRDFVTALDGTVAHEGDACGCGDPNRSDDCPADCPNCHCPNGSMALPPLVESSPEIALVPHAPLEAPRPLTDVPPDGSKTSIFRPPRRLFV